MISRWRWKLAQKAELLWWKNYLSKKSSESYREWKKSYWVNFLQQIGLSDIDQRSNSIIDLGCGPAGIFMVFNQAEVVAVDPLLKHYESNLPHFKISTYSNVDFQSLSIETFSAEHTFDYVFCLNAINHVADLPLSFDRMVACLGPKGTLIVSIDAHNYSMLKRIFRAIPGDILHPHQYDLKEYSQMLISRGCHITQTICYKKETIFNYYILVATKKS